jgi:hypothetical protein
MTRLLLIISLLLLCLLPRPGHAATLIVNQKAPNAADTNPGTRARPFKTISAAADRAAPGATVLVADGDYHEAVQPHSGTANAPITFRSQHKWGARVVSPDHRGAFHFYGGAHTGAVWPAGAPGYVVVDGFDLKGAGDTQNSSGVWGQWAHHLVIQNCRLHDSALSGVALGFVDYITVQNCVVFNNCHTSNYGGSGISLWKIRPYDRGVGLHNLIARNTVYGNAQTTSAQHSDGDGIIIDTSHLNLSALVENNVVFANGGAGILNDGSANVTVVNNTCYDNGADPNLHYPEIMMTKVTWEKDPAEDTPPAGCYVAANIAYARSGHPAIQMLSTGTDTAVRGNLRCNGTGDQLGPNSHSDYQGDPLFLRPGDTPPAADFHLRAGSPAIDGSITCPATDRDITRRPQGKAADIGAYERAPRDKTAPELTSSQWPAESARPRSPGAASPARPAGHGTTPGAGERLRANPRGNGSASAR